ncbi:MAG: 2-C-methyl-D-erythritol 4-phosphate cytidylyltransferase [Clostridia bacterium]|nr:2-C-methyl-D-erythritol 4-phosphate cytidylyltransferase [Clostridia bacterium]
MNVILLLSAGVGKRFGASLPKQYQPLCGRPVVQYVLDAALRAPSVDEIVIVMDPAYKDFLHAPDDPRLHYTPGGRERLDSVRNGLDCIVGLDGECDKLMILQAVNPFVTTEMIETYFSLLDEYDAVTTAEKCPGELFNREKYEKLDRNRYYFCQSPEAFRFRDLNRWLDVHSPYSELIYHYPGEPKVCFYTEFHNNVKLTYMSDLQFAEFLMQNKPTQS